jgi:hypothetical protein
MIRFGNKFARLILLLVVCHVIISAFLVSPSGISNEPTIYDIHYGSFYGHEFLEPKEEKEFEESITLTSTGNLLNIHEHNLSLNRSHSYCLFQSVKSISYRFTLFCALLI